MKTKVLVILGPTASGKSDLAVKLALWVKDGKVGGYKGAEIISADSRQVYRGLDIGTGKITRKEMRGVRHHIIDVADPRKRFTVEKYKRLADEAILDIASRGKLPIICGGTGFYIDAVLDKVNIPQVGPDDELRAKLAGKSPRELLAMLRRLDPKRWRTVNANPSDKNNPRRLIRAIEIAGTETLKSRTKKEGKQLAYSETWPAAEATNRAVAKKQSPLHSKYDPIFIGLQVPRIGLRKRIHTRLLRRLERGMIAEVRRLHRLVAEGGHGLSWKRMEELGLEYRYLARFVQGKISRKEMVKKLDVEINRYAKRQMTWFRRNRDINWFSTEKLDKKVLNMLAWNLNPNQHI